MSSKISEEVSLTSGQTYKFQTPFIGSYDADYLTFKLGTVDLSPVGHPDFLKLGIFDKDDLAELQITISRFDKTLIVNQQNQRGVWKTAQQYSLDDFFTDGEDSYIRVWTTDRKTGESDWKGYVVDTAKYRVNTEVKCYLRSPTVRFERSCAPIMKDEQVSMTHWIPE
ncbi:hypothetical protein ABW19_dt0203396 [Dactylella cylindrospora]|nr:hypothetical protein ABW19_dt0203396 [Dactylella cylindrospora]